LLESALARARNAFAYGEEDIVVLAVSLMAGVARAHAFEQGNKRTAFAAMRLFLRASMATTPCSMILCRGQMR
jgi:death-on-curing protein